MRYHACISVIVIFDIFADHPVELHLPEDVTKVERSAWLCLRLGISR